MSLRMMVWPIEKKHEKDQIFRRGNKWTKKQETKGRDETMKTTLKKEATPIEMDKNVEQTKRQTRRENQHSDTNRQEQRHGKRDEKTNERANQREQKLKRTKPKQTNKLTWPKAPGGSRAPIRLRWI